MTAPGAPSADEFRRLFDAEVAYVWKSLRRLGVRPSDIEDVANEVWVTVYRRLGDYDRARPLRPWLFGITFRVATGHKRLAYHRREVYDIDDPEASELASDAPSAEDQMSVKDAHQLVLDALTTLDIDRRAVFVMHDMDSVPMKEISEVLGVGVNTAYSRLRIAREEFKAAVVRLRLRRARR